MGDEGYGAAVEGTGQGAGDDGFGARIERGGGFVEDEDAGIAQQGACEGDALALAGGDGAAALADDGVVGFGEGLDEVVDGGIAGAGANFIESGAGLSVGDIFADGGAEEEGSLLDEGDVGAKIMHAEIA